MLLRGVLGSRHGLRSRITLSQLPNAIKTGAAPV